MESKKRKREEEPPRITFVAPEKTFERILKGGWNVSTKWTRLPCLLTFSPETSLAETKDAIRKKLGLNTSASIELMQVRGNRHIDLEDGTWKRTCNL